MNANFIRILALVGMLLAPAAVWAQLNTGMANPKGPIQIKGHPQKAVYNSPAEWPLVDGQGHWCPGGSAVDCSGNNPARLSHGHLGCQAPIYAIVTGPITFPCRIMLFQIAGHLSRLDFAGPGRVAALNTNLVWEGTGTDQPPTVNGDPGGLVTLNFLVTMDPSNWPAKHGSAPFTMSMQIAFDNGDALFVELHLPFWAALDTTQPPSISAGPNPSYQLWPVTVDLFTRSARGATPDSQIIRLFDYLPLPGVNLGGPWRLHTENGRYGAGDLTPKIPAGFSELRTDVNLHSFVEGSLVERVDGVPGSQAPVVIVHDFYLDPAKLAAGQHNGMLRWGLPLKQKTDIFAGGEEVQALLTFPFAVGPGGTPPAARDSDGDGVVDDIDACPNTPAGTSVDHHSGCPVGTPGHPLPPTTGETRVLFQRLTVLVPQLPITGSLFAAIAAMLGNGGGL